MLARISSLGPRGVRAILWHQGESDTHRKPEQQLSADQYTATMEKVIRVSRERAGWAIPWFTAQATYWGSTGQAMETGPGLGRPRHRFVNWRGTPE